MNRPIAQALNVLLSPSRAFILWVLITATVASCLTAAGVTNVIMARSSGATLTGLTVGAGGVNVALANVSPGRSTLVMVDPIGWQDAQISATKGQRYIIEARGRVNVDLAGTVEHGTMRQRFEHEIVQRSRRTSIPFRSARLPEDDWTTAQLELLRNPQRFRPWNDPDGFEPPTAVSRARAARRALPNAPLGALIGQFRHGDCPADASAPFMIGKKSSREAPCNGELWFAVNDVVFPADPSLFFQDNVGLFIVVVATQ